jgi:hypothetical protein
MAVLENERISTGHKPRIVGIVGLSFLGAVVNVLSGLDLLTQINAARAEGLANIADWVPLTAYVIIAFGLVQFVVAVLVMQYKRLGLIIGLIIYSLNILLMIVPVAAQNESLRSILLPLLVQGAVVYYMNKYLNHEPEKSYFT